MNASLSPFVRLLLLAALTGGAFGLASCTTTDDASTDTRIYPTAAEKNRLMAEDLSQMTRSFQ